jgi:hypothetical protein
MRLALRQRDMDRVATPLTRPADWSALVTHREWARLAALLDEDALANVHEIVQDISPGLRRMTIANLLRVAASRPPTNHWSLIWHADALTYHELIDRAAERCAQNELSAAQTLASVTALAPRQHQQPTPGRNGC